MFSGVALIIRYLSASHLPEDQVAQAHDVDVAHLRLQVDVGAHDAGAPLPHAEIFVGEDRGAAGPAN